MSCGAEPKGHKKFCSNCRNVLSPQQVICVQCGTTVSASVAKSNATETCFMWMHLTWFLFPLVTLIIWSVVKDKNHDANIHGKNILNVFFTTCINLAIALVVIVISLAIPFGLAMHAEIRNDYSNTPLVVVLGIISGIVILTSIFMVIVRPIASSIEIAKAAEKGEILPYSWATEFYKTDHEM